MYSCVIPPLKNSSNVLYVGTLVRIELGISII